jgi:GNAT superfamily N-acetyltransferase
MLIIASEFEKSEIANILCDSHHREGEKTGFYNYPELDNEILNNIKGCDTFVYRLKGKIAALITLKRMEEITVSENSPEAKMIERLEKNSSFSGGIYIKAIAVDRNQRGRGIGTKVVKEAITKHEDQPHFALIARKPFRNISSELIFRNNSFTEDCVLESKAGEFALFIR